MPPIPLNLTEIQGNIIAGFNKDHQRFLFLRIDNAAKAKLWLKSMIPHVSNTKDVKEFNDKFRMLRRKNGADPTPNLLSATWLNIAFTSSGIAAIGQNTAGMPPEFVAGMASRSAIIGDIGNSAPAHWQAAFSDHDKLHIVVMIASDSELDLMTRSLAVIDGLLAGGLTLLLDQPGENLTGALAGHEQFGFKDGVSQPGVKGFTTPVNNAPPPNTGLQGVPGQDMLWPGQFVIGYETQIPVTVVGFDGPNPNQGPVSSAGPAWTKDGSFLVFRKLAQDVAGFRKNVADTAATLGIPTDVLGAKFVGRYASGCPMQPTPYEVDTDVLPTLSANAEDGFPTNFDTRSGDPSDVHPELLDPNLINNFEYGPPFPTNPPTLPLKPQDPFGTFVPRAGHIRKVYPRDELFLLAAPNPAGNADPASALDESFTQTKRLLRRGIPYGPAFEPPPAPQPERGLLFLAYQASIANQFEFVQQSWINNPDFPEPGDGLDPVMSQMPPGNITCPIKGATKTFNVPHFVTTSGGEYFFQPSISTLGLFAA